jgi:hypothetical protein
VYTHCEYNLLWSVQSLLLLSLTPLFPTLHFSTAFSTHPYTFISYVMQYYWCSIILFSFLSCPDFLRVVPLLQTCSTLLQTCSEFVYDHACFWVYVYLWIYLPHMRENMQLLHFWVGLTSLNMMFSNCIHLPSDEIGSVQSGMAVDHPFTFKSLAIIPCGWVILHCVDIFLTHSSVVRHLSCMFLI